MALIVELATLAGVSLGELKGPREVGVRRGVKLPRTARFSVTPDNPRWLTLRSTDQVLAKVYDQNEAGTLSLRHVGKLTMYQRSGSAEGTLVTVGSTGPEWILPKRAIRQAADNRPNLTIQRGQAMRWLIQVLNGDAAAADAHALASGYPAGTATALFSPVTLFTPAPPTEDTGIRHRTIAATPSVTIGAAWLFTPANVALAELAAGLDGPDWAVYPVEPVADALGVQIGALDVAPTIGTTRPDVVFECGTGRRNVASYTEVLDPTTAANEAIHLPPGFPDSPLPVIARENGTARTTHGVMLTLVNAELTDATLRGALLDDYLTVLGDVRRVVAFTVAEDLEPGDLDLDQRRIPRPVVDYDFGDVVTFRAAELVPTRADDGSVTGYVEQITVDDLMRVYAIDESDDADGKRTTTLVLVEE